MIFRIYYPDDVYRWKTHKYVNWQIHIELFGWRFRMRLTPQLEQVQPSRFTGIKGITKV